jgi:DNA-binding transcriptional LysR family regulator
MTVESIRSAAPDLKSNPELTLRGLRIFVALEEVGSIGGAAERIGGSPAGVSQQISALELAVGAKLFDRRARPVILTPAGQVLSVHAHRILDAVSEAQAQLAELRLTSLPQLTLAIIDDLDASLTPVLVASLQKRFHNCFVHAYSGRSDWVTERLVHRKADIAVSGIVPLDINNFRSTPILREPFILVTAKGILGNKVNIRDQLSKLPFVEYSESMPIGVLIAQHLKRMQFKVPRRFTFDASRSVFAMVVQTGGWAITTPLNILDAERFIPQVDILPLPFPALSRRVYLVARDEELGHLPKMLADDCRRLISEKIIPRFSAIAPELASAIEVLTE